MTPFRAGDSLGRYRIERPLGHGAMGDVYLGTDPQIDRPLALKTLRLVGVPERELDERKERLLREARTAGRLIHPHIVTLFDAGEQDGVLFLAFEYVAGSDLARILAERPMAVGEALRIAREACEGLAYAHRHGIVHRDVKPSNLMLDAEGRVKIADFGIAKMKGQGTELTVTGSVMGSPHYLSPEQVRGEDLDGRSDLFSLGIVLYEALAGRRPFQGETISTLVYQILGVEAPTLSQLRPGLAPRLPQLLDRFLAKDRKVRVQDAQSAAREIAALERELPAELLAAPALATAAPTDATAVMDEAPAPPRPAAGREERVIPASAPQPAAGAAASGAGAAEGTSAAGVGSGRPAGTGMPGGGEGSGKALGPLPPPPPPVGAGRTGAPLPPPPPGAEAPASPEERPAAAPSSASGSTYAVPAFSGRRRGPWLAVAAALLVLTVAAVGGFVLLRDGDPAASPGTEAIAENGAAVEDLPADLDGTVGPGGGEEGLPAASGDRVAGSRERTAAGTPPALPRTTREEAGRDEDAGRSVRPSSGGLPDRAAQKPASGSTGAGPGAPATSRPGSRGTGSTGAGGDPDEVGSRGVNTSPGSAPAGTASRPGSTAAGAESIREEPLRNDPPRNDPTPDRAAADSPASGSATAEPLRRESRSRASAPPPDVAVSSGMDLSFEIFPPDAFVLVNGTVIGRAAEYGRRSGRTYALPDPGTHRITLRRDGMEDFHVDVQASRSGPAATAVRARLKPLKATEIPFHELEMHRVGKAIAFKVDAPGARVLVDDEPRGLAQQYGGGRFGRAGWLELPLGQHRVSLIAPGRQRVDFAVDVSSGATEERKRIDVVLPPLPAEVDE